MKAFAVALLGLFALTPVAEARTRLSGAGASFPSKIYTRWFSDVAKSCLLYTSDAADEE